MARKAPSASPWPLLVALGIAVSEVGVLFGFVTVAIGGVLLFGSSAAGIVRDAGYTESIWWPLAMIGGVIGFGAVFVWVYRAASLDPQVLSGAVVGDPLALRAAVVLVSALILIAVGTLGTAVQRVR